MDFGVSRIARTSSWFSKPARESERRGGKEGIRSARPRAGTLPRSRFIKVKSLGALRAAKVLRFRRERWKRRLERERQKRVRSFAWAHPRREEFLRRSIHAPRGSALPLIVRQRWIADLTWEISPLYLESISNSFELMARAFIYYLFFSTPMKSSYLFICVT